MREAGGVNGYKINWPALVTLAVIVIALGVLSWVVGLAALVVIVLILAANGAWNHSIGKYGIGDDYVASRPRRGKRRDY